MRYFQVRDAEEARRLLSRPLRQLEDESVTLDTAVGRVLARDVLSPEDAPPFPRAVVDGYAVRAVDTFGASPSQPAYLRLAGEVVMGAAPDGVVGPDEAVRIPTGGAIPPGANAVLMLEHAEALPDGMLEAARAVAPGDGMVEAGDDLRAGDLLLPAGRRLRPADAGALAGAGILEVTVFRRPRVAVIPTGDELVPPAARPGPGQIRDVNSTALAAAVRACGGEPVVCSIVSDDRGRLEDAVRSAWETCDMVLVGGGSSVGARDWTLESLLSLPGAELLFHGLAIRPGKPVIAVEAGGRLAVGLPGNPVSALLVFERFLRDPLRRLGGEAPLLPRAGAVRARLARSVASDTGMEDAVRVRLVAAAGSWLAEPLLGKSTLLRTLVEADGFLLLPAGVEGAEAGEEVTVQLLDAPTL